MDFYGNRFWFFWKQRFVSVEAEIDFVEKCIGFCGKTNWFLWKTGLFYVRKEIDLGENRDWFLWKQRIVLVVTKN